MGPRAVWARIGEVALGVAAMITVTVPAVASAAVASPGQTGPYPVSSEGGPGLCWQAAGNGSPVTLERCDPAVQGQQWTLTGDGVFMNGNGYCLEAGTGDDLFIGFDGQCGGTAASQQWAFSGGQLRSRAGAVCAASAGPLVPGTAIVTGACGRARWGFGASTAPTGTPKRSTPQITARPATQPSAEAGAANSAAAGPAAGQGGGEQAVLMVAGLLAFGGLLVLVGRRSRQRGRTGRPGPGRRTGGSRRAERTGRTGQEAVVDSRPTEPFDVSSTF